MFGLLPDAVREAIYAAEEWCDRQEAHARPPLLRVSWACCQAWSGVVYGGALSEALHGEHHRHKFSKLQVIDLNKSTNLQKPPH